MIITDRDTTRADCDHCGWAHVFSRILSTREVLRLRCPRCTAAKTEEEQG